MKLKFAPSAPLEICICMVSFGAGIKIFRFWPKAMDYSKAFRLISLHDHNPSLEGATKLKFASNGNYRGKNGSTCVRRWHVHVTYMCCYMYHIQLCVRV